MSDFVGCTNYYNCQNIQDSHYVLNSNGVDFSTFVHDSTDISHCSDIYKCDDVTNSNQIFYSQFIYSSERIDRSSNVDNCTNVLISTRIYNSRNIYVCSDIMGSGELRHCDNIESSYFCANSKNLKDCMFCHDLEGKQFHIFNQPVTEEKFNIIRKQYLRLMEEVELDYLREQWPQNMLIPELPNVYSYHNKHYLQLSDKFWRWARTIPGYDAELLYRITLNFDLL